MRIEDTQIITLRAEVQLKNNIILFIFPLKFLYFLVFFQNTGKWFSLVLLSIRLKTGYDINTQSSSVTLNWYLVQIAFFQDWVSRFVEKNCYEAWEFCGLIMTDKWEIDCMTDRHKYIVKKTFVFLRWKSVTLGQNLGYV